MKTALVDYRNSSQLPLLLSEAEKISEPSQIVYFELSGEPGQLPFSYLDSLSNLFESERPDLVLFPHTDDGCELASRLSCLHRIDSLTNVTQVETCNGQLLKNAIMKYDGTVVIVSHDREFLDGMVQKVYEFRDGGVKDAEDRRIIIGK